MQREKRNDVLSGKRFCIFFGQLLLAGLSRTATTCHLGFLHRKRRGSARLLSWRPACVVCVMLVLTAGATAWSASEEGQVVTVSEKGAHTEAVSIPERALEDQDAPVEQEEEEGRSPASTFQAELDALRSAYTALEEDRARRREAVELRMIELMVRAEEKLAQIDMLEREVTETREQRDRAVEQRDRAVEQRDRAVEERDVVSEEYAERVANLTNTLEDARRNHQEALEEIQALSTTLQEVRAAKSQAEDAAATRIAELEESLNAVRGALEDTQDAARAREEELESRISTFRDRESALQAQREEDQAQWESELSAAESRIAQLEEDLSVAEQQLDSDREAARARRAEYLETEERLQASFAEKQAQYTLLRAEYNALQKATGQALKARGELSEALAAEKLAREAEARGAAAAKADLRQRLAAEEKRVNAMADELQRIQAQWQRFKTQSEARMDALEAERDEKARLLHEGTLAMGAIRGTIEEWEARWEAERAELENALKEQYQLLQAERTRFAESKEELALREEELQKKLEAAEAASELDTAAVADQIATLEAELAQRDAALAEMHDSIRGSALDRAIQELTLIEEEFAQAESEWEQERQEIAERIETLEAVVAMPDDSREELSRSLAAERQRREALEEQVREKESALSESEALREEATAALNQYYDTMRKQLEEDGVSVQVAEYDTDDAGLVPLIGRIGAFAESATLEMHALRRGFEAEQQALMQDLEQVKAERDALVDHIESLQAELNRKVQESEHAASPDSDPDQVEQTAPDGVDQVASIQAALDAGDLQQAVSLYEQVGDIDLLPLHTLRSIANAYRSLRQHESAYALYETILQRDPSSLFAEQKKVLTLFDMGEYERALEQLTASGDRGGPLEQEEK